MPGAENKKVREKDVFPIAPGPSARLPLPRQDGDFETAHSMLLMENPNSNGIRIGWKDFSELVFGDSSQESISACAAEALLSRYFRIADGLPEAIPMQEIEQAKKRAEEKSLELQARARFISELQKKANNKQSDSDEFFARKEFSRYIVDIESIALGQTERCPLLREAGFQESKESAHSTLIETGIWETHHNPWPQRAGCMLHPPRGIFPENELPRYSIGRTDLSALASYAIDNAWSLDPDDAIGIDGDTIWIHVADPASYIEPGSDIDIDALNRGSTLYLPEKTIPMLPHEALPRLGLGLSELSPSLSFGVRLDSDGGIKETHIIPSTIRVKRLSYEEADALLSSEEPTLSRLDLAAKLRKKRRAANGAVDIDMPEVSIKAHNGKVSFTTIVPTRSAEIVKEMMLLAGEAAGRWAWERGIPLPYSSQEAPQVSNTIDRVNGEASRLSEQFQRRKGMKSSSVGPEPMAHQGLGLPFYSQVTSPLRRYQDLLAHYQIRIHLAESSNSLLKSGSGQSLMSNEEIMRRCLLSGQASSGTRQAERDSRLHWIALYLHQNPDWSGNAVVLDSKETDAYVIIPELGLETIVKTRSKLDLDSVVKLKVSRVSIPFHDSYFERVSID
jgi:exoribonuclease-2